MNANNLESKFAAMGESLKACEIASRRHRVMMNLETQSRTMANVVFLD
jgi:hypothetical protein